MEHLHHPFKEAINRGHSQLNRPDQTLPLHRIHILLPSGLAEHAFDHLVLPFYLLGAFVHLVLRILVDYGWRGLRVGGVGVFELFKTVLEFEETGQALFVLFVNKAG